MATYRVGIIGCGNIAKAHVNAYRKTPGVEVVTGSELDPDRREAFARDFQFRSSYADYTEMLEKENLDIVSVCTWPKTH